MPRIGYFIKNVRENDNPTAANDASTIDVTFAGTPDFGGKNYHMFYQWPSSLTANSANGTTQGALAYVALLEQFPNMGKAIDQQPSSGFDSAHIIGELQQVYDSSRVTGSTYGDDFRLRVGKRIYIFGYAYSSSAAIDPDTATITWKD
jgi:hypothetical protein